MKKLKKKITMTNYVVERFWDVDDSYLVVPIGDIQMEGFKEGDKVKICITVEKI